MQYGLLIYQAEEVMESWSEADLKEALTGHGACRKSRRRRDSKHTNGKNTPCERKTGVAADSHRGGIVH